MIGRYTHRRIVNSTKESVFLEKCSLIPSNNDYEDYPSYYVYAAINEISTRSLQYTVGIKNELYLAYERCPDLLSRPYRVSRVKPIISLSYLVTPLTKLHQKCFGYVR